MKKPKKQPSYSQLKKIWYKKLKDSGFDDIEYRDESISASTPTSLLKRGDLLIYNSTINYYDMANEFLNNHKFDTELERVMWEYHANGLGVRNIAKILNDTKVIKTDRNAVFRRIKKLQMEMKKKYLLK